MLNSFQRSLDRYLTSEPADDFTPYVEEVYQHIPQNTYDEMEADGFLNSKVETATLSRYFTEEVLPKVTARHLIQAYYENYQKGNI